MRGDFSVIDSDSISVLCRLAQEAGALIMSYYCAGVKSEQKADKSPVTIADRAAEDLLTRGIAAHFGGIQIIGEEACAKAVPTHIEEQFFLLDPLDGTSSFINNNRDFTVNIGLIDGGQPQIGIIYAPAYELLYYGAIDRTTQKSEAFMLRLTPDEAVNLEQAQSIRTRTPDPAGIIVMASKNHRSEKTDTFVERLTVKKLLPTGSSLKLCRVAEGAGDIYPRHSDTMEWDIAAGHAILEAAGGQIYDLQQNQLRYGKLDEGLKNPHFIAASRQWWQTHMGST